MKRLLYCALTLLTLTQNLEIQAAESKATKKGRLTAKQLADKQLLDTHIKYSNGFSRADIPVIEECLQEKPEFLDLLGEDNFSPFLSLLAGTGLPVNKVEAAKKILSHEACTKQTIDHQNSNGSSSLFYFLTLPNTVELFTLAAQKKADFSVKGFKRNINLLMRAIEANNEEAIKYLLANHPHMLTEKDSEKKLFPLGFAIQDETPDPERKELLDRIFYMTINETKAQFSPRNFGLFLNGCEEKDGKIERITTPFLIRAIQKNNTDVIKHLLSLGADPNYPSADKFTPLHYIAQGGTRETFETFMETEKQLELDLEKRTGENKILPFLVFAVNGKPEEALIIARKMNPDTIKTALKRRIGNDDDSFFYLLDYLLNNPKKYPSYKELLDFIIKNNPEAVNTKSPNKRGEVKVSPLILAACGGNIQVIMDLIEKGADPDYIDEPKSVGSFLCYAIKSTKSEVNLIQLLEFLGKKGLNHLFLKAGENGLSPLIAAIMNSKKDTIRWLAKKGAFAEQTMLNPILFLALPKKGTTEPSKLTKEILQDVLDALQDDSESKYSLFNNPIGSNGESLIHRFVGFPKNAFRDKDECLKLLLTQSELKINAPRPTDKCTPLMVLLNQLIQEPKFDCIDTLKILLGHNHINLRLCDSSNNTVLHMAAKTDNPAVFELIKRACEIKCPEILILENNEGHTYQYYKDKGTAIKSSLSLLAQEGAEKREAALRSAQELLRVIEREIEAEIETKRKKEESYTTAETIKKEAATAAEASDEPEGQRVYCSYTKTLKMWRRIAEIFVTKPTDTVEIALETLLERDGYLSDPTTETDPIRKTRANVYQNLKKKLSAAYPGKDEVAIDQLVALQIAKEHGFPDLVIRTVINNYSTMQHDVTEETDFQCIVPATYQDSEGIHTGTYEIYGKIQPGNRVEIHHALFRETAATGTSKVRKIPAASSSRMVSKSADSTITPEANAFKEVGRFRQEKIELADKTIHTITDLATETVYTLEIPK